MFVCVESFTQMSPFSIKMKEFFFKWTGMARMCSFLSAIFSLPNPLLLVSDLMTEMTDLSGELEGSGIPFLDYNTYAQRVFFPGQGGPPSRRGLDLPEGRRATVEQGLGQLSNLLNSKVFLLTVGTLGKRSSQSSWAIPMPL